MSGDRSNKNRSNKNRRTKMQTNINVNANISQIVKTVASEMTDYNRLLMELRVFKDRAQFMSGLHRYRTGLKLVKKEITKYKQLNDTAMVSRLTLIEARFHHFASAIYYAMNKLTKAIALSLHCIEITKDILDSSSLELIKVKQILAVCYKDLQQSQESLDIFQSMHHSLNEHLSYLKTRTKTKSNKNNNNNSNDAHETTVPSSLSRSRRRPQTSRRQMVELQLWKSEVAYNMAMIYNSFKDFKNAVQFAKESMVIRNLFAPKSEKQILSLMLVAVVVSAPAINEYKLSMDCLQKGKDICSKIPELSTYLVQIDRLCSIVLPACIRWAKLNGVEPYLYLKNGSTNKVEATEIN